MVTIITDVCLTLVPQCESITNQRRSKDSDVGLVYDYQLAVRAFARCRSVHVWVVGGFSGCGQRAPTVVEECCGSGLVARSVGQWVVWTTRMLPVCPCLVIQAPAAAAADDNNNYYSSCNCNSNNCKLKSLVGLHLPI